MFPILQVGLVAFVLFAVHHNWIQARRAGRGGVTLLVTRGEISMSRFFATYAAISGLLIAICLTVEVARNQRIL